MQKRVQAALCFLAVFESGGALNKAPQALAHIRIQSKMNLTKENLGSILQTKPIIVGSSKMVYHVDDNHCLIKLVPTLSSFTYNRYESFPGTEVLRLDFYEMAAQKLSKANLPHVFHERVGTDLYLAEFCPSAPFEVIVKNFAYGSTLRKYPGLFQPGHMFQDPVVKFDYRTDPEDQPIADDYLREFGYHPQQLKTLALAVNQTLRDWLSPRELLDFCVIIAKRQNGTYIVTSEISPDCMRLREVDGASLDKDLFRAGKSCEEICFVWSELIESIR